MNRAIRRTLPLVFALTAMGAHAQFYNHVTNHLKGGSVSVGATGQFTKVITSDPQQSTTFATITNGTRGTTAIPVFGQQQFTTDSLGFVTHMQFHPVSWAGIELNYGFTHYSEKFAFNYQGTAATQRVNVLTDQHELTGAYTFHPKHIPFQPFVNIGGGALDYTPNTAANQWRGVGLAEAGFDIPTHSKHLAFRVEGRGLFGRAPNFYTPQISTRAWRVQIEPAVSTVYRF